MPRMSISGSTRLSRMKTLALHFLGLKRRGGLVLGAFPGMGDNGWTQL